MFDITTLITTSNLFLILAILLIVGGCILLFGVHIKSILLVVPSVVIEFVLYVGLGFAVYVTPKVFSQDIYYIWGLLFAMGLSATTCLTGYRMKGGNMQLFYFVNMLIHAIAGMYLQSSLVCSVAVSFFMSLIGFHMGFGQGYVVLGYTEKKYVASATMASGIVTFMGSLLRVSLENSIASATPISPLMQYAQLFVPGMIWLGPSVFFLSMLISSSKLYCNNNELYASNNMLNILLSASAVVLGNLYGIPQLSGFSGTFFALFLAEKYVELVPNRVEVWAITSILVGTILYAFNVYFRAEFEKYGLYEYFHLVPPFPNTTIIPS